MDISVLTSSLPLSTADAIDLLADYRLTWIDVPPTASEGVARERIRRHGLQVGCVGLEREAPEALDLASSDRAERNRAVEYYRQTIVRTADLGAAAGYLTPPISTDDPTRARWCESIARVAEEAEQQQIDLCVEHFPGRLLPTTTETLQCLEEIGNPALRLLIDIGHCLISQEDPARAIRNAGSRLGYVHFDDNDGVDDLHWGLLEGCLTEVQLQQSVEALREIGHTRPLCLEFLPTAESERRIREGIQLLRKLTEG